MYVSRFSVRIFEPCEFVLGTYGITFPCERCGEDSETSDNW